MPDVDVLLPAGIGEGVQIQAGELAGQIAMVLAWRVVRPRFLLGGLLDGDPQVSLLVITEQGEERWLGEADIAGFGEPDRVSFVLAFTAGDDVLVHPTRSEGMVVGWEAINDEHGVEIVYRVHMAAAPPNVDIEVEEIFLELRPGI